MTIDDARAYNGPAPTNAPTIGSFSVTCGSGDDVGPWVEASLNASTVWIPGNQVRYALSFEFVDGQESMRGMAIDLDHDRRGRPAPADGYPHNLSSYPGDVTGRSVYRQCEAADGTLVQDWNKLGATSSGESTFDDETP